jgi:hypothetical protein
VTARAWLGLVLVILVCGATASALLRCEGDAPELRGPEQLQIGRTAREVGVEAVDVGSGVRSLELRIAQGDLVRTLGERSVPGSVPILRRWSHHWCPGN